MAEEREQRAHNQFTDERLNKLESQFTKLTDTVTQYVTVLDEVRESQQKQQANLDQLIDAGAKKIAEAAKKYVDDRLTGITVQAQPAQGSETGQKIGGIEIPSRIGEKIFGPQGLVDKIIEGVGNRVVPGMQTVATVDTELFDLNQQVTNVLKAAYKKQLNTFLQGAAKEAGLSLPAPESVRVVHK